MGRAIKGRYQLQLPGSSPANPFFESFGRKKSEVLEKLLLIAMKRYGYAGLNNKYEVATMLYNIDKDLMFLNAQDTQPIIYEKPIILEPEKQKKPRTKTLNKPERSTKTEKEETIKAEEVLQEPPEQLNGMTAEEALDVDAMLGDFADDDDDF